MHVKEENKSSNTGVLARLAIEGACLHVHGKPTHALDAAAMTKGSSGAVVLFPGPGARELDESFARELGPAPALIVPDGSWGQATQMVKRVPGLSSLPTAMLPRPKLDVQRPRINTKEERMSTFEAVAQALAIIEAAHGNPRAEEIETALLDLYTRAAERHLHMRGKIPRAAVRGLGHFSKAPNLKAATSAH